MDYNDHDPVEVLAERVKYLIENKNGEELVSTLSAAETYLSDRKELLYSAFFEAGNTDLMSWIILMLSNTLTNLGNTIQIIF